MTFSEWVDHTISWDILEIMWFGFAVERSKVKATESVSAFFTVVTNTHYVNADLTELMNTAWV